MLASEETWHLVQWISDMSHRSSPSTIRRAEMWQTEMARATLVALGVLLILADQGWLSLRYKAMWKISRGKCNVMRLVKSAAATTKEDMLLEMKLLFHRKVNKKEAAIQQLQEQLTRLGLKDKLAYDIHNSWFSHLGPQFSHRSTMPVSSPQPQSSQPQGTQLASQLG